MEIANNNLNDSQPNFVDHTFEKGNNLKKISAECNKTPSVHRQASKSPLVSKNVNEINAFKAAPMPNFEALHANAERLNSLRRNHLLVTVPTTPEMMKRSPKPVREFHPKKNRMFSVKKLSPFFKKLFVTPMAKSPNHPINPECRRCLKITIPTTPEVLKRQKSPVSHNYDERYLC